MMAAGLLLFLAVAGIGWIALLWDDIDA